MHKFYNIIIILLIFIIWIILLKPTTIIDKNNIFFNYPKWEINFAWEKLITEGKYYYNKERFDKEYLITSKTLYQLFLYIKRYPLYIPYIEKKLKENNIPDDFKYLAIAESALLNNALSHASASWIWQFMPDTARRFWLIVNDKIDERYNFEKSTDTAIKYFKVLYNKFNNRTLAAAAFNRWEWWIARALDKQNVNSYYDLYLNEETSRYVFRILAIKYVLLEYFKNKNIIDVLIWWTYKKPKTKTIKINKIDNIIDWCKENNVSYKDFILLNQWIIWDSLPEWDWEIKILDN